MGLYDTFASKEKCPYCGRMVEFGFQTKSLVRGLYTWKKGEKVETENLIVKDGIVRNCISSCVKCSKENKEKWFKKHPDATLEEWLNTDARRPYLVEADIVIQDNVFKEVINIRKR